MSVLGRLSIRARITIGTLLLAAVFFTGAAFVVHHQVESILRDSLAQVLRSDIGPYITAIQTEPDGAVDVPSQGQLIAVIDPAGATRTSTLPPTVTDALGSLDQTSSDSQELTPGGGQYLVTIERVSSAGGTWTVVAARNEDASSLTLMRLTAELIAGLALLTVVFGGVSWLLTGAALRPVTLLRRSAERIVSTGSADLLPVGPARDEITDLAATLNRLIDDLRASAARERQMVSDASHELRTPLAVLQTQLELMRTGDRGDLDADIRAAERATERLSRLVADLLELSRLDAGPGEQGTAVTELVAEAGEAVDRARLRAAQRSVTVELSVPESVSPAELAGMSAASFGRVLDNLLTNALAAMGETGAIELTVSVEADALTVEVADTGHGVAAEFLPHAFDRFSQEDPARSPSAGAGLGLAIVAAAVEHAGGTVRLENGPRGGARASARLPLRHKPPTAG
jgi:signal transduction histidine kinase